jgi:type IV secretion system protein VirD4
MANRGSPIWIKALVLTPFLLLLAPLWLFVSGHVVGFLWFRFHMPALPLLAWVDYWHEYAGQPAMRPPLILSAAVATVICLAPFALFFLPRRRSLHGEARFARMREIRRAGLLENKVGDGIIFGRIGRKFLTAGLADYPHVMLAAPTASGKGVGVVIPNLLHWNHSVIVLDIKGENWQHTAGFRARHGHKVFLFDPGSPQRRTHRWNPLAYVRVDYALRVDDIQKIGHMLFPDIPNVDPMWSASCRSLFLGLVLYLLETPGATVSLGQVAREMYASNEERSETTFKQAQAAGTPYSITCVHAISDYLNTSDNTRTSIRKTFTSRFELFLNPILDAATAGNDFDLEQLRRTRMSLYIGISPDNLGRLAPLLNLFFQQVVDLNTRVLPEHDKTLKYQLLLLLDEFKSLGKMPLLVDGVAFLRGYGVRLLPIFQSPSQVREIYGDEAAKTFFENHHVRITYTPATVDAATDIARELGNYTFKARSISRPHSLSSSKGGATSSTSDQQRALMLPQELRELGTEEAIIFAKGVKPIHADKIRWYQDPEFKGRPLAAPEVPVATLSTAAPIMVADHDSGEAGEVEALYEKPFSHFKLDFSDVEIPKGPISENEAEDLADKFYASLTK